MSALSPESTLSPLRFLDRTRTVAGAGYNRWLVPPAALAIHLAIGQAYAFSVFNLPLTQIIGVTKAAPDDWKLTTLGWIFSIAIVFLGLSAAVFGKWLEAAGPRKAMFASAVCFSGGFLVSAVGVSGPPDLACVPGLRLVLSAASGWVSRLYLPSLGSLSSEFPDRPGMATGLAIMEFHGRRGPAWSRPPLAQAARHGEFLPHAQPGLNRALRSRPSSQWGSTSAS